MKNYFLTLILALIYFSGYSQQEQNWVLFKSIDGVEIYTQEVDCYAENIPAQKAILIKVVNKNSGSIRIEWDLAVWYNNEKLDHNIKDGENHFSIELSKGSSQQGSCNTPYGAFYIFKDFITYVSPTKLTRFDLENVTVTQQ